MKASLASAVAWDFPAAPDTNPSSAVTVVVDSGDLPTEPVGFGAVEPMAPAEVRDVVIDYVRAAIGPEDEAARVLDVLRAAAAAAFDADQTAEQFVEAARLAWAREELP